MVKQQRFRTFLWIIIVVLIFVIGEFADSKKHRALHSRHHHHNHQRQRKHPKIHEHHHHHHLPLAKNLSRSTNKKNNVSHETINMTRFLATKNSFSTATSLPNSNFSKKDIIISSELTTMWNTTIGNVINTNFTSKPRWIRNNSKKRENNSSEYTIIANHFNFTSKPREIFNGSNKEEIKMSRVTTIGVNCTSMSSQIFDNSNVSSTTEKFKDSSITQSTLTRLSTNDNNTDIREMTTNSLLRENETIDVHLENITSACNSTQTLNTTREFDEIPENKNPVFTELKNISAEVSTSSQRQDNKTLIDQLATRTYDVTSDDHQEPVKELQQLFGLTEEPKDYKKIDDPMVVMIRKKRLASEELDEEPKQRTLLDFNGPAISNDPEETEDWSSSNVAHKRVKRDRSLEFEEDESAAESNYLQDLEDSFAPSALEIQAQSSQDRKDENSRQLRSSVDSSFVNKLRVKRDANENKDEVKNDPAVESGETSSSFLNNDESYMKNRLEDGQNLRDTSYGVDSNANVKKNDHEATRNDGRVDNKDASMEISSPEVPLFKYESTSRSEFNDVENSKDNSLDVDSSAVRANRSEEDRQYQEDNDNASRQRKSPTDNAYLQDDNTISRNRLDDVYPDINEYPQHPSPMIQLVRTKRFGDSFLDQETPDVSYANEQSDARIMVDEPYAEDNRIIDTMLSKVNYRNVNNRRARYARRDNDNPYNKMEIEAEERAELPIRDKRDSGFARRTRQKSSYEGNRKHKKKPKGKRKKKKKKKHRGKTKGTKGKRASLLLERELRSGDSPMEIKRDSRDNDAGGRFNDIYDPDVISPHDGRRRRDYEDENDENIRFDNNERSLQVRRDLRDSEDVKKNLLGNWDKEDISRCAEERDRVIDDNTRRREKRDTALQELKYYENVRETNDGPNVTSEMNDKKLLSPNAVEPIKDIKELVQELLVKVNDLHGYINEGDVGQTKDTQGIGTVTAARIIARTTELPSKIVQRKSVGSGEKSKSKPVNAMIRRKARCKSSTKSSRRDDPGRNGRPSKSVRVCAKKVRRKRKSHRKWERWTDWSSCSVTCGRGRQIRWRHCMKNCSTAETEMEEKACQLPACAPGKFLGIFG